MRIFMRKLMKRFEFGIELYTVLSENTFSEEDKKVIKHSRNLTDFLTFHEKIQEIGPV